MRRTNRPDRNDERPIFLIPRIPGTGLLALFGLAVVLLTIVSATMQFQAEPAAPAVPLAVEDPEPAEPLRVRSVLLRADPPQVLQHFRAVDIGMDMWRLPDDSAGPVLFMLEDDGLWAHGVTDEELAALDRAGFAYEEIEVE